MIIDKKEASRYLGYGKNIPDDTVQAIIDECIDEIQNISRPRQIHKIFPLKLLSDESFSAAGLNIHSKNLTKNLRGCTEIIFFAATLGIETDQIFNRYLKLNMTKAAVFQAVAAAAIEGWCNECQLAIEEELKNKSLYVRPRFSPGYGDLSLNIQPDFLNILNAGKTIGITLSSGGIMLPEKSVTAFMGISPEPTKCSIEGCEACGNTECLFRRN